MSHASTSHAARREGGTTRVPLWAARALWPLTVLLMAQACSGDDDTDDTGGQASTTTQATSSTTTESHPSAEGDDQAEAFMIVEDLVLEAAAVTDRLFQDPPAAEDPDNDDVVRLQELYTDDSPTPDGVLESAREMAGDGQRVQASASGVLREMVVHDLSAVDGDTVQFAFCANQDHETVNETGEVVDRLAEVTQGHGEARRVDNVWRLYALDREAENSIPTEPGQAMPGFCQNLYPEDAQ